MKHWLFILLIVSIFYKSFAQSHSSKLKPVPKTTLVVLGTSQDAGSPQINCTKICCKNTFEGKKENNPLVSLGLIDPVNKKQFLFEATPNIVLQLRALKNNAPAEVNEIQAGIFITHACIGHYTGLMYLGKEAMNANQIPVYVFPKMRLFLEENGPWSQLVSNQNIKLNPMSENKTVQLRSELSVLPFRIPHRDEFSETVGYKIIGSQKSALFIPDIDKWEKWGTSIIEAIKKVDYAFIDATFFSDEEIKPRDLSEIPHPFVIEGLKLFKDLATEEKTKIFFIHLNHTNPLLNPQSQESLEVERLGFGIARTGDRFSL
tara:strand:- start:1579 stop:2532 length:954 start_codon:yes stop_codon:yes gene_type:complete